MREYEFNSKKSVLFLFMYDKCCENKSTST